MRQPSPGVVDADDSGRFAMTVPSAGSWRLTASAAGYVNQAYDAHGVYSSAVVLTQATPAVDLKFSLAPQSRIAGTILDEAGEGVRNATVELITQPLPVPSGQGISLSGATFGNGRRMTQTDDRGAYEFAGLVPGSYRIRVQARPWYASTMRRRGPQQQATSTPQETDLDVIYPTVWYPGVTEQEQAAPIVLHPGDQQQADFQLAPAPSLHLQVVLPRAEQNAGRPMPMFPTIERVDNNDPGQRFISGTSITSSQGQVDIGGLAPGTYRVSVPGRDSGSAIVQITEGSSRSVDLRESQPGMGVVTLKFDGEEDSFMTVELIEANTGQRFSPGGFGPMPIRGGGPMQSRQHELTITAPAGKYEVVARSREQYLTGISAQGAEVSGRFISFSGGDATVTLHTASGRASISGIVTQADKPCSGAFLMIVPAGLDDPGSFTTVVRDQSDTDGSFNLENIVPGQYILIAVDHGWNINWSDPSTLRRYLTQGTPLEVRRDVALKQNIEAQAP
jgi:protocatechuate 3,4-dioxygenase beta subunit